MADKIIMKQSEIIEEPGKFEGLPDYIPYFHDKIFDFGSDHMIDFGEGEVYDFIIIDEEDRKKYPDLENYYGFVIWVTEYGFVKYNAFESEEEYRKAIEELEREAQEFYEKEENYE